MWTVENRGSYDRGGLRYPSDVTDDEWAHIAPLIPPAKRGGRKRNVDVRDVVNGLMGFVKLTGFTPKSRQIVDGCFTQFQWLSLVQKCRKQPTIS